MSKKYDVSEPSQQNYRVTFAATYLMRGYGKTGKDGRFDTCFSMGDGEIVIKRLLKRAVKNAKLREALYNSNRVDMAEWIAQNPETKAVFDAIDTKYAEKSADKVLLKKTA